MRLILALFFVVAFSIENSSQNIYNDIGDHDGKCTIHSSDNYQTRLEVDHKNSKSKDCGAVVKCLPNEMTISLPESLLASVDREDLRLLDSNCTATENGTHFVLTTTLIGCGTFSRHTNSSVVYSNKVRQVHPERAVITRTPEIHISFSCYYSKYGFASTGAIRSKNTHENFESDLCWNNRLLLYRRMPSCPIESTDRITRREHKEEGSNE